MIVEFNESEVQALWDHAQKAKKHYAPYGERCDGPGLILVGDQGVYLMSNGQPGLKLHSCAQCGSDLEPMEPEDDSKYANDMRCTAHDCDFKGRSGSNQVAYAAGTNPYTDEDFWDAKVMCFGGDDGAEMLNESFVKALLGQAKHGKCRMSLTPTKMEVIA